MPEKASKTSARIAVRPETRDMIRSLKRGGETYDELLRKMAEQYEPPADYSVDV